MKKQTNLNILEENDMIVCFMLTFELNESTIK